MEAFLHNAFLSSAWSALAQSVVCGLILAAGVRLLLLLIAPVSAASRFAVWMATLVAVAVMPPLFFLRSSVTDEVATVVRARTVAVTPATPAVPAAATEAPVPKPKPVHAAVVLPLPADPAEVFLCLGAFLSTLLLVRLTFSYFRVRRLRSRDVIETPPEAEARFRHWLQHCPTVRPVRLILSRRAKSAMAVGFRVPAIVLPESLLVRLTVEEFDHLGLHELAHIRRWDDWTNLLQHFIQALLFWHPAVFWVCRRLDLERELACDDAVLNVTGEPKRYARSLARVLELAPWTRGPVLASGAVFRKRQIIERIERLVDRARIARTRISGFTVVVVILCLVGALSELVQMPALIAFDHAFSGPRSRNRWSSNGRTIDFETTGEVQFAPVEPRILSVSPDGYAKLRESGSTTREITFTAAQSGTGVEAHYRVDGRERPLDNLGREWSATTLTWVVREMGINAEERASTLLAQRGATALLDETDRIGSEHTRRKYLQVLLESDAPVEDHRRAMARVARFGSDHDKAEFLIHFVDQMKAPELRTAWFDAANTIHSDHDRRRTLEKAAEEYGTDPFVLAQVARSAQSMGSDHDKAELLKKVQSEAPADAPAGADLLAAVGKMHSDHDKANVLVRLTSGPLSSDFRAAVLTIGSDHEKERVITAMLEQSQTPETPQMAVSLAATLGSDHEKSSVLQKVLAKHGQSPEVQAQVRKAAEKIGSDTEYRRVVSKIQFEVQCKDAPSCG